MIPAGAFRGVPRWCHGWRATVVFLDLEGTWIEAPDDGADDLVAGVAAGQRAVAEIAQALERWR